LREKRKNPKRGMGAGQATTAVGEGRKRRAAVAWFVGGLLGLSWLRGRATAGGEGKVRRCRVLGWLVCGGRGRGWSSDVVVGCCEKEMGVWGLRGRLREKTVRWREAEGKSLWLWFSFFLAKGGGSLVREKKIKI
jgi:hypothetical protein